MREWKKPELVTLAIQATKGGGATPTIHDGVIYTITRTDGNVVAVEEYES